MARSFLTPINLNKLELQNAAIQNLATPPGSPATGQVYYDTSTTPKELKIWDGGAWVTVGYSEEQIEDFVDGLIVAGTGISKNYNDGANTLTIANIGVTSLAGTTNEVLINGGTSAATGAVTLSLPATISADLSGNASTASTLQTARVISLTGSVSGSVSFNGGSDVSIPVTLNSNSAVSSITSGNSNITTSASVGAVTIALASNLTGVNAASATYAVTSGTANSVAANSVNLGTDTVGNYIATASAGSGITVSGSGSEGAGITISNAGVLSLSSANANIGVSASTGTVTLTLASNLSGVNAASATYAVTAGTANSVAANSVPLGTATTGNYVTQISGTDGVSITGSGTESASVTIANTDKGSSQNIFKTIIGGTGSVTAGSNSASVTFSGGTGISTSVSGSAVTITNTGVTSVSFDTTGLTPNTATTGAITVGGTLAAKNGGTGQSSYAAGDLLYASASTTLSKLSASPTGNVLLSGTTPSWGKVGLTTHVSGTLAVGNGGTGLASTPTNGQLLIGNGTNYSLATLTQGTGITVTNGSGTISIANAGVTSITGTANQVIASASVGAVTLSLPQDIHTGANPTFAGLNAGNINIGITTDNEIDTDSGNLTIDSAGGTVTIDDNLTVTGNLTVSGSVTYINTQTLEVADNLIVLNSDVTAAPTENAGIEVERGTSTNVSLLWNETDDRWTMTNDGTNFYAMTMKYAQTLSSSSTMYFVDHNLNSQDVSVSVYRNSAPFDTVEVDEERTTANRVTLRFAVAPSANEYRVVVVG